MPQETKAKAKTKGGSAPISLTSDLVAKLAGDTKPINFEFEGQRYTVNLRRLTGRAMDQCEAYVDIAPPSLPGKEDDIHALDYNNPEYRKAMNEGEVKRGAAFLVFGCPEIFPEGLDMEAQIRWALETLPKNLADFLVNEIQNFSLKRIEAAVNFPSASASESSPS